MLDGKRRKMGIHREGPSDLGGGEQLTENLPVPIAGLQNDDVWPTEQFRDACHGFFRGKRRSKRPVIRPDSQEGEERHPRESHRLGAREGTFKPAAGGIVVLGRGVVRVEKEVRINKDQRCSRPSSWSSSSPMLS